MVLGQEGRGGPEPRPRPFGYIYIYIHTCSGRRDGGDLSLALGLSAEEL